MTRYGIARPWVTDLDQMRREFDTLFNRFGGASSPPREQRGVTPAMNLYESADAYIVTAELPGVEPDSIDLAVEGTTISLRGERSVQFSDDESTNLHRSERRTGSFRRAFELPGPVDPDGVVAEHRHGVLKLRLPKTPEARARQIAVQAS